MHKVRIMISTRQGMLRKYLLVCRHLMNKLELQPLANYTGWSSEQIRPYRNLTALKFFTADATKRNFSFDFVQTFLVLSGTAERP